MALKITIPVQYRTLDHTILFIPRSNNILMVKIYQLACQSFDKILHIYDLASKPISKYPKRVYYHYCTFKIKGQNPKKAEPLSFLEHILEGNPLQRSICPKEITIQDCIEESMILFQQITKNPPFESEQIETFTRLTHVIHQLQENKVDEAIKTVNFILQNTSIHRSTLFESSLSLLLIKLYCTSQNKEAALNLALEKARELTKKKKEALDSELVRRPFPNPLKRDRLEMDLERQFSSILLLYKQAILLAPHQFILYQEIQNCIVDSNEKAHYLLLGASRALQLKDFSTASSLCKEAEPLSDLFLDRILQIELLKQQNQSQQIIERLQGLHTFYREKQLTLKDNFEVNGNELEHEQLKHEQLKVDKMLASQEEKLSICGDIARLYEELKKPNKAVIWYHKQLNFLIKENELQEADVLADKILSIDSKDVAVYQILKTFYEQRQPKKLSMVYGKLGQCQLENEQIDQAEATFKEGLQKFPCAVECVMGIAKILLLQNKLSESVQQYYAAADIAFVDDHWKEVSLCLQQIKELDRSFNHLQASQRIHIMMLSKIAELQNQVEDLKKEVRDLKEGSHTRLNS
jgi:hypothetical protein